MCKVAQLTTPPKGSELRPGGSGSFYKRTCPGEASSKGPERLGRWAGSVFWAENQPPAEGPDPEVLAQTAIDEMTLGAPEIGIVPKPGKVGVVGMPVWMWTEQNQETWGPNTAEADAGGVTVKAKATVEQIRWDMGDGNSVTCTSPGTPYKPSFGKRESPDCGYTYRTTSKDQPNQKFTVRATSTWKVSWEGGGQTGELTQTRSSNAQIAVGEVQVVN